MDSEIWKDIPNYKGIYKVSNLGRVKSLDRIIMRGGFKRSIKGTLLSQGIRGGYKYVGLNNQKKKKYSVHQLVAMAFLNHTPSMSKKVVDHINNVKTDNRLTNLQVVSHRENTLKDHDRTGFGSPHIGAYFRSNRGKWVSKIQINNKSKVIGSFNCPFAAHVAYTKYVKERGLYLP